ncbi:hypothetical protein FHS96_005901 [Sphingomonas zeicaulis]|uniref:hypothetical protein n=1 Tax=Sphingomonas zeicaulis TaxID=1632740 RepID=UPI003D1A8829
MRAQLGGDEFAVEIRARRADAAIKQIGSRLLCDREPGAAEDQNHAILADDKAAPRLRDTQRVDRGRGADRWHGIAWHRRDDPAHPDRLLAVIQRA